LQAAPTLVLVPVPLFALALSVLSPLLDAPSLPVLVVSKLEPISPPKLVCSAPVFGLRPSRKFPSMDTASPTVVEPQR
jgi:hypothetical protein